MSRVGTFDGVAAQNISLKKVALLFNQLGAERLYVKKLSSNDNSKNQIYLGSTADGLKEIPKGEWTPHISKSRKPQAREKKLLQNVIQFHWVSPDGGLIQAPNAKLIYYPQYPEVRFSGFLKGSKVELSQWMNVDKSGRAEGRYLIWGVTDDDFSMGYFVAPDTYLSKELAKRPDSENLNLAMGAFQALSIGDFANHKASLITLLKDIHLNSPHRGALLKKGKITPYKAQNAGGMTLESLLGIEPNGKALPDYHGYEVKGHSNSVITMMTPQPDGGLYAEEGAEKFVLKYGYPDVSGKPGRLNFGGAHRFATIHPKTRLSVFLRGYSLKQPRTFEADGCLGLEDVEGTVAATWSFIKLLNHWQSKHANTVFVPYSVDKSGPENRYSYSSNVQFGEGTSFQMLLSSIALGNSYYDPGIKLELNKSSGRLKQRNQWRVKKRHLSDLFETYSQVDLLAF